MSGPVTFSFLDEMQTFGLADYRAAQTRMAIAKERRGIERDTLLRDKHLSMRHKAALAAKMTPSSLGRLVIGLAMAMPGILARSRGRS